jgi:membrane protease subunit HflK
MTPTDPRLLSPEEPTAGATPAGRRAGSLTLREAGEDGGLNLDPANQSLADALRVMLRLLQAGMVVLGILYLLSGMQRVNEGERGIRLIFGQIRESNIEPGFHWSPPYPIGELVRVPQGYQELDISKDFWVDVPAGMVDTSIEKLPGTPSLKPDQNGTGSVITGDGNIAHTKWKVGFERVDVSSFTRNVHENFEQEIVKCAVKRAVVQAVSEVTLTELLQQSSKDGTVASRARALAQETLDNLNSGLQIRSLTMDPPIPPLYLREDFNRASAAAANASKTIADAQSYRSERLNQAAGNAAKYLIYYIDQYEKALAHDDPEASKILNIIDALMLGKEEVEVLVLGDDGLPEREEEGQPTGRTHKVRFAATGEIAATLSEAMLYRTGVRSKAQTTLSRFEAKLQQWKANPTVMMQTEWTEAMRSFMSKPNFEMMMVPPGVNTLTLLLNSDPDIEREVQSDIKRRIREETERKRNEELMRKGRETDTTGLNYRT